MIGAGKYDFPGMKKAGRMIAKTVLAGTGWGVKLLASPFWPIVQLVLDWCLDYLANRGLLIINVGAIYVKGEFDQASFDKAMDSALEQIKKPGLTEAQKKVIDEQVKDSFRRFARVGKP